MITISRRHMLKKKQFWGDLWVHPFQGETSTSLRFQICISSAYSTRDMDGEGKQL